MNLAYLTPFYKPSVGGAAVYVSLLSKNLKKFNKCKDFEIITEQHPLKKKGLTYEDGIKVNRLFPFRAGASTKNWKSYYKYAWQNLQLIFLFRWITKVDILFLHGSFLNNLSTVEAAISIAKYKNSGLYIILDIRDPKFPETKIESLKKYDAVISCSKNISQKIKQIENVWEIPIMIEPFVVDRQLQKNLAIKYGLEPPKFIFYGSGIGKDDNIEKLIQVIRTIRSKNRDIILVIAGKKRFWSRNIQKAKDEGILKFIGSLPPVEARTLAVASWVDVNISKINSFPRHSLEVFASGGKVLFPAGVPELEQYPHYVATENCSVDNLANKIIKIGDENENCCEYPWKKHLPEQVIPQYLSMLDFLKRS